MQSTPVVFLSFANQEGQSHLRLEKEGEALYNILLPAEEEQGIKLHREPFANTKNIADALLTFSDRVLIFHYGGHANGQSLFLQDQSATAQGIAQQLSHQKQLQLVFLNGCSTHQQVQTLLDLGIPAVIATNASINDATATQFATYFYKAIMKGHTLKKAFKKAAAIVQTATGQYPAIYRDTGERNAQPDGLPWGLYVKKKSSLKAKLILAARPKDSEKNVVREQALDIEGNVHIGDKKSSTTDNYSRKNIVEKGKMKIKGDFRLGDG